MTLLQVSEDVWLNPLDITYIEECHPSGLPSYLIVNLGTGSVCLDIPIAEFLDKVRHFINLEAL